MDLHEHQGKQLFSDHGIPTPEGVLASSPEDDAFAEATYPAVVKAQVLTGGRGKAGGIQLVDTEDQARDAAREILGMEIDGHTVRQVLVEERIEIEGEHYLAILLDRSARDILVVASAEGGVDIESVAEEKIAQVHVDPLEGVTEETVDELTTFLDLSGDDADSYATVLRALYETFRQEDAQLTEINPLALTPEGFVAADSKVSVDNNALYRHDLPEDQEDLTPLEQKAKEQGIAFVQLEGEIGVIANGAGLTMATLDALIEYDGVGGVFLDLGGTDDPEEVAEALTLMKEADPSVILVNLFGGITKTDTVAKGIIRVLEEEGIDQPVVTRIKGRNEAKARELLRDAGFVAVGDLKEAAEKTVEIDHKERGVA